MPGHPPVVADHADAPPRLPFADALDQGCRHAAVAVIVYPASARPHLVLTLRQPQLRHHPGQVSLPGGAVDPGETPEECALREVYEELGIVGTELEHLGPLTPLYVPPSNYCLFPVVAAARVRPAFRPAPAEVAEVLEVALDDLLPSASSHLRLRVIEGRPRRMTVFPVGRHEVWGATAAILAEVAVLWADVRRHVGR